MTAQGRTGSSSSEPKKMTNSQARGCVTAVILFALAVFLLIGVAISWRAAVLGYYYTGAVLSIVGASSSVGKKVKSHRSLAGIGSLLTLLEAGAVTYVWSHSALPFETRTILASLLWASCLYDIITIVVRAGKPIHYTRMRVLRTSFVGIASIVLFSILAFAA